MVESQNGMIKVVMTETLLKPIFPACLFTPALSEAYHFNGDFLQISNYKPSRRYNCIWSSCQFSCATLGSSTSEISDVAYQYSGGLSLSTLHER